MSSEVWPFARVTSHLCELDQGTDHFRRRGEIPRGNDVWSQLFNGGRIPNLDSS